LNGVDRPDADRVGKAKYTALGKVDEQSLLGDLPWRFVDFLPSNIFLAVTVPSQDGVRTTFSGRVHR
jgi:hypothetical protein